MDNDLSAAAGVVNGLSVSALFWIMLVWWVW